MENEWNDFLSLNIFMEFFNINLAFIDWKNFQLEGQILKMQERRIKL